MTPSRTFTLSTLAISAIFLLGVAILVALVSIAFIAPEQLASLVQAAPTAGTFAMAIAAAGGVGAGALGYRDGKSGGLTSSSAASVLAGMRLQDKTDA